MRQEERGGGGGKWDKMEKEGENNARKIDKDSIDGKIKNE